MHVRASLPDAYHLAPIVAHPEPLHDDPPDEALALAQTMAGMLLDSVHPGAEAVEIPASVPWTEPAFWADDDGVRPTPKLDRAVEAVGAELAECDQLQEEADAILRRARASLGGGDGKADGTE